MTISELAGNIKHLRLKLHQEIHMLRHAYALEHAKFKVGDYIGNVTGIIKVDAISYKSYSDGFEILDIVYYGKRYRKYHGEYILTKNQKHNSPFYEDHSKLFYSDNVTN